MGSFNIYKKIMAKKRITIAIDGHSSTGKSTMAKTLAQRIGYTYVDTGAMYRTVALFALRNKLIKDGKVDVKALKDHLKHHDIKIRFRPTRDGSSVILLNGRCVEGFIRKMRVSNVVSIIAAIPYVRKVLVRMQQAMGQRGGVVMDGRDIGTVVFPNAEMKVFATASPQVRAQRRFDELQAKGDTSTTLDEVLANVIERDRIDSTRKVSPLRQAPDAVILDNSHMTIDEQNEWLYQLYCDRLKAGLAEQ